MMPRIRIHVIGADSRLRLTLTRREKEAVWFRPMKNILGNAALVITFPATSASPSGPRSIWTVAKSLFLPDFHGNTTFHS